ncbi:MAG: gliding motility-associated ABC transporter ATP-binding subunit GldA [Bacteroidia bacterium]
MSILVNGITKLYGKQKALDSVTLEIRTGEIVGFLGPNGAGKSTLMKILTCFLPQTSGKASVCGFDVEEQSMEVRKNVGYLPEHNPLYHDMYVKEYLEFICGLHHLDKIPARISKMIELTGLTLEQKKKIGALSKGYRQRVGLAQALIHDPRVLILDEPTTGLDPNQLAEIRHLIMEIGKEKTVMLSTHIMQEVEAVCSRVIIINKGQIVADGATETIQQGSGSVHVITVEFDKPTDKQALIEIEGVEQAEQTTHPLVWKLTTLSHKDIRPSVFRFAVEKGLTVLGMQKEEQKLEDIFKQLTKDKI